MDPMKLITYVTATFITVLLVIGGLGFYVGYSAGRKDISEVKAYIAAARLNLPAGAPGKDGTPTATISLEPGALEPVMTEIKALGKSLAELQQRVNSNPGGPDSGGKPHEGKSKEELRLKEEVAQLRMKLGEITKEDNRLKDELASVRQRLTETAASASGSKGDAKLLDELNTARSQVSQINNQAGACQIQVTALENRLKETEGKLATASRSKGDAPGRPSSGGQANSGSLLFYDSITLKRAQSKVYSDVDVSLSLEGVAARAARVAINRQSFSINFGERKVFQHNDATCELVLMESDLESSQARFNITCKR